MKTYKIIISGKEIEVLQDEDGRFIKPDIVKDLESYGTALKPAFEPICMAMKPLSEKNYIVNCLKYGTGGINIDESRVELPEGQTKDKGNPNRIGSKNSTIPWAVNGAPPYDPTQGRFPANLIHDNSPEVRECFPNESERFFKSIIYTAKASKSERDMGCEGFPISRPDTRTSKGMGTFEEKGVLPGRNNHPTVKPVALMEYLIKMITPKGGVVLDPFMGSGSTGIACKKNGYGFIGIEKEPEYMKIAEARINNFKAQTRLI